MLPIGAARVTCAIDPGPHTGVAWHLPKGTKPYQTCTILDSELHQLWTNLVTFNPRLVALEIFKRSERIDHNMIVTMEIVGGVKAICCVRGMQLYLHNPGMERSFYTQAKQMLHGHDHTEHERDALAHLLTMEYLLEHPGEQPKNYEART